LQEGKKRIKQNLIKLMLSPETASKMRNF